MRTCDGQTGERRPEPGGHTSPLEGLPEEVPVGAVLNFENPQPGRSGLLRSGALVSAVALLTNGFNIIFHFATARFMGPEEYSLLTTMFAVFVVAAVPLLALQATLTREMSTLIGAGNPLGAALVLRHAFRTVSRTALVCVLGAVVLFIPLIAVLGVQRPLPILAVSVAFLTQVPGTLAAGALVAAERFVALSWTQSLQVTIKLAAGVGLAAAGFGASAVTFGVAVATAAAFVVAMLALRDLLAPARGMPVPKVKLFGRYSVGAAMALGLHTVLVNTDLIWSRALLPAEQAGLYAAASVATTAFLLVPIGITTVLFPRIAQLDDASRAQRHLFWATLITGSACAVLVVPLIAFPGPLLHVAFGGEYDGARNLLWPLGVSMSFYAMAIVYINHLLALGRSEVAIVLLACALAQQVAFGLLVESALDIVYVQIAFGVILVVALHLFTLRRGASQRPDEPNATS